MMILTFETPQYEAVLDGTLTAHYLSPIGFDCKVGDEITIQEITPLYIDAKGCIGRNCWRGNDPTGREVKAIITYVDIRTVALICFKVEDTND